MHGKRRFIFLFHSSDKCVHDSFSFCAGDIFKFIQLIALDGIFAQSLISSCRWLLMFQGSLRLPLLTRPDPWFSNNALIFTGAEQAVIIENCML